MNFVGPPTLAPLKAQPYPLFELCGCFFFFCLKGLVEGYDFACETFLFGIEWGKSVSDGLMCHES